MRPPVPRTPIEIATCVIAVGVAVLIGFSHTIVWEASGVFHDDALTTQLQLWNQFDITPAVALGSGILSIAMGVLIGVMVVRRPMRVVVSGVLALLASAPIAFIVSWALALGFDNNPCFAPRRAEVVAVMTFAFSSSAAVVIFATAAITWVLVGVLHSAQRQPAPSHISSTGSN
jgi:hypothetical protein